MYFYKFVEFIVAYKGQFIEGYIFKILYEFFGYG